MSAPAGMLSSYDELTMYGVFESPPAELVAENVTRAKLAGMIGNGVFIVAKDTGVAAAYTMVWYGTPRRRSERPKRPPTGPPAASAPPGRPPQTRSPLMTGTLPELPPPPRPQRADRSSSSRTTRRASRRRNLTCPTKLL